MSIFKRDESLKSVKEILNFYEKLGERKKKWVALILIKNLFRLTCIVFWSYYSSTCKFVFYFIF